MGFYSWKTLDTNKSISNIYSSKGALPVVMVNPLTGEMFEETSYEGYGEFGGKDYYELLAEINGKSTRSDGIHLECENTEEYISPLLLELNNKDNWKQYVGKKCIICNKQGFFY
jgi:hypothetical protein